MSDFELFAFYSNEDRLCMLNQTDVTGFIVDVEKKGKEIRQELYNTQITEHNQNDLRCVRKLTDKWVICRVNNHHQLDPDEISVTIDNGADEVLIPMVRSVQEVEQALAITNNQVKTSIMLETTESLSLLEKFNDLPIERCYVGLNDLSIQRKSDNIFTPLIDGTMEKIAAGIDKKLGVAGLTHPKMGHPIPCQWLIDIMRKNNCTFGILRRSFYRDLNKAPAEDIITELINSFDQTESPVLSTSQIQFIKNATLK